MSRITLASIALLIAVSQSLFAQPNVGQAPNLARQWTDTESHLGIGVLVFMILVMVLQFFFIKCSRVRWSSEAVIRFVGFPFVISSALLLVIVGYSDQQVAPVFALLGAIAGYLFGAKTTQDEAGIAK